MPRPARSRSPHPVRSQPRSPFAWWAALVRSASLATAARQARSGVAVAVVLTATGVLGGPAAAVAADDTSWTVSTAANDYGSARNSYGYALDPGSSATDAMVVTNRGSEPIDLAVYAADGFTNPDRQVDLLTAETRSVGVGAWVQPQTDRVTVEPGQSVEIPFTVTVPDDATPGDHVGGILTSMVQADQQQGITVDRRLGIKITLRVSGELRPALAVEDLHISYAGSANPFARGRATLTYTVRNTGNVVLTGRHQQVSLSGVLGWGRVDAARPADPPSLLPGERWHVTVPVDKVAPTVWLNAKVEIVPLVTDPAGTTTTLDPVVVTGHGWAVPWSVLGLLLVVVALVVLGVVWRRRQGDKVSRAVAEALAQRDSNQTGEPALAAADGPAVHPSGAAESQG
ncbi:MAG: DUF916 domain-containing protein [Micrococcales bacterium]|nr:DUF916 domain-containing protein [Micrococcales bacterium]